MNHWCIWLIAAGVVVVLLYFFAPGTFLRLSVLVFPKDHERRWELVAELYHVPFWKRPAWVAGNLIRCFSEGPPARSRARQARKGHMVTAPAPSAAHGPEWEQDQAIRERARKQGAEMTDHEPIPTEISDAYMACD